MRFGLCTNRELNVCTEQLLARHAVLNVYYGRIQSVFFFGGGGSK